MDLLLAGKRAIVTGGSRGIGLACAQALVAEGASVALIARSQAGLDEALAQFPAGSAIRGIVGDTTDTASVQAAVAEVAAQLGGVDILVNAAAQPGGGGAPPKLDELAEQGLRDEIETKVLGYLRCIQAVAPLMREQGWGRIVNISGLAARSTGSTFGSIRNVAVAALTKNAADELAGTGINVTVVHPGMTVTERTPALVSSLAAARGITEDEARARLGASASIGRMVTAQEVADVVTFLASPRSVAINGDAIAVGGGVTGPIYY
jgi:NAD(P)-dependent dehydrogenase (short-subunit alcohol dehydrogenase family)